MFIQNNRPIRFQKWHFISLFVIVVVAATGSFLLNWAQTKPIYEYQTWNSFNGLQMHVIQTTPDRIQLVAIDDNLTNTDYIGMNGGFFYDKDLLSIAVQNHQPVKKEKQDYGSGWYNEKYRRGTLVWDGDMQEFSIQTVKSADQIEVHNTDHYWAQGGVSMKLSDSSMWSLLTYYQNLPAKDEYRMRAGLVYDDQNLLYLIVTPTHATAAQFREAILQEVAPGRPKEGIFLDGDGSSQLQVPDHQLPGDGRAVKQIITIQ